MEDWLKRINREIQDLDFRARELEAWLLENTESANWFRESSRYNDILFRMAQKKEKIVSYQCGAQVPETVTLPSKERRHNKQI